MGSQLSEGAVTRTFMNGGLNMGHTSRGRSRRLVTLARKAGGRNTATGARKTTIQPLPASTVPLPLMERQPGEGMSQTALNHEVVRPSNSKKRRCSMGTGRDYSTLAISSLGRRRGVVLVYRKDLQLFESGGDRSGRFVWAKFRREDEDFNVVSVYGPNNARERIEFWRHLRDELPQGKWLAAGDWNAVASSLDSSSKSNVQSEEEAVVFQDFCAAFSIRDAREWALKTEGPRFSHAQFRQGKLSWSRIDRVYFSHFEVRKVIHHVRAKFISEGDACSGYFFRRFRRRRLKTTISKIKTDEGVLLQNPDDIKLVVQHHYTALYSQEEGNPGQEEATESLLSVTDQRLSPQQKLLLDDLPSDNEIFHSLLLLPQGKSPGIDGMSPEVMRLLWPFIGRSFCAAGREFWLSGSLLPFFKDGLIFLLPKVENPATLGQWRPITLLNTVYKVLAKLLASRLALVLPTLVPREQQGFVKGRTPQNCVITFSLVHEALKRERRSAFFVSLDQDKAYDRLLPSFLWRDLQHLDFPVSFVNAVKALQEGVESTILFNGHLLSPFKIGKGVRQGCPLSPLLFVLASIPLIQKIKAENARGSILAVNLGPGIDMSSMCLADDLAIFTQIHRDSFTNLLVFLDLATGGRVNLKKSKVLMIGVATRPPDWLSGFGLSVVGQTEVTRYLGAPLSTTWRGIDNGQTLLQSLHSKTQYFSSSLLPFESRVLALKHGVFLALIYQMSNTKFKRTSLHECNKILRGFLWSVDSEGKARKSLVAWDNLVLPMFWGGLGCLMPKISKLPSFA
ncbi:hypothetical protein R1sor_017801 [Riccia sorocarpa]|uniref:Reverse transcriptase domain-containing protein n=1 Tax=Riccia sorocarpa TaxID=122646 RepID=A0ABD3IB52_9MARC